jgi:hypothetical protein
MQDMQLADRLWNDMLERAGSYFGGALSPLNGITLVRDA